MSLARRNDLIMGALFIVVIALDQLTKHWITSYFTTGAQKQPIALVGNILQLEYDFNKGVAFSLLWSSALLFVFIALALVVIGVIYWRIRDNDSIAPKIAFGLILGGAVGNLIDRVDKGYVTDFIHFQLPAIHFDFAIFNVADSCICVGVALLAFILWRGDVEAQRTTPPAPTKSNEASPEASDVRVRRRVEISR